MKKASVVILTSLLSFTAPAIQAKSKMETSGDIMALLLPGLAMGATLVYEPNYEGSWQLAKSAIGSRVMVEGLKYSIDKERPDGSDSDAFPSGHTADSFMAATFIQQRYGWKYAIPAYLGATFVGYSRVDSDQHYVEDVLAGAAIGILSSWYFTQPFDNATLSPIAGNGTYGLRIQGRF